jgi:DNA-binding transcriptional regulator YiaG
MPDRFVRLARTRLDLTDLDLARKLGVTVGCLRSWDRKGAPRYVQLALCALIAGVEPEAVEGSPTLAARNPKAHLPAE